MNKFLTLIFIFGYFITTAQSIKTQILENASEIKSVNINDTIFSDLEVIGSAIGNAKIVFLGEQDHGDATTFEAKARIIRYLHEKKGFNILAFESDFFSINKKSDQKKSIDEIEESIFPIWSNCAQVNPLFDYIKSQKETNPITISGFDCQIAQKYEDDEDKEIYLKTMKSYIENNIDISKIENYDLFQKTLKDLIYFIKKTKNKNAHFRKVKKSTQKKFYSTLSEILNKLRNKNSFNYKSLENALYYAEMAWDRKKGMLKRDIQMGENILWLSNYKFPDEKLIVWAHSAHLIKETKNIFTNNNISAGDYVVKKLNKDKVYSIGFSSRKGESFRTSLNMNAKKYKIPTPKKESFENWLHSKKYSFAFINFKKLKNLSEDFYMKGISHYNIKANWLTGFDGIFYIDKMYPCIKEK